MLILITFPSLFGVRFKSAVAIAFSISFATVLSNGSTTNCWDPDEETRATWLRGV
jgi:hypothetical protein